MSCSSRSVVVVVVGFLVCKVVVDCWLTVGEASDDTSTVGGSRRTEKFNVIRNKSRKKERNSSKRLSFQMHIIYYSSTVFFCYLFCSGHPIAKGNRNDGKVKK